MMGPFIFLFYINDIPQAVKSNILLYADDTCIFFQHADVNVIEKQLNEDFSNLCDWFVDNKLSIHFGEDKTKSILFTSKRKVQLVKKFNITYNNIPIKQHASVSYLGCILDNTLSGESMALSVINKVNSKLRFLYRNKSFLNPQLRRLMCNALIQPHFDYASSTWYLNLTEKFKKKIQVSQNKCIRFCLNLDNRAHIGYAELKEINWLNIHDRQRLNLCTSVFKFFNNKTPLFMSNVFHPARENEISTRSSYLKLQQPFRKTKLGQNTLSYLGSGEWNKLPTFMKKLTNVNTFKHKLKDHYLEEIKRKEQLQ